MKKQTLCHEIIHGIFVMIGCPEHAQNEQLVQSLAMAINQSFDVKGSG